MREKGCDNLLVRSAGSSEPGVDGKLHKESGLLLGLIRMRAVAVLGDVGDVGGEGSAEGCAGVSIWIWDGITHERRSTKGRYVRPSLLWRL